MSAAWEFAKRFVLAPALAVGGFTILAMLTDGWTQALGIGLLAGVAFTGWVLSSVLAWKLRYDAAEHAKLRAAVMRELGYTHGEETVRRLRSAL